MGEEAERGRKKAGVVVLPYGGKPKKSFWRRAKQGWQTRGDSVEDDWGQYRRKKQQKDKKRPSQTSGL